MNDTKHAIADSGRYYNYKKRKPLLRRLISPSSHWVSYCDKCRKPVPWDLIIFGIDITPAALTAPIDEMAAIKLIRNRDWSMIAAATCPIEWYRSPTLKVHAGYCESCRGPFSLVGKIQGVYGETLRLAATFLGELDHTQALALLEIAFANELYGNDKYRDRAIAACKALGSAVDFEAARAVHAESLVGMEIGRNAMQAYQTGRNQEALDGLHESADVFKKTGQGRLEATSWMNIGLVHLQLKAAQEAQAAFDKSITLATAHTHPQIAATSQTLLAILFRDSGDFPSAESAFHRALKYDVGLPSTMLGTVMTLFELAEMLIKQARDGEAREQLQKALELARELGVSDSITRAEAALQRLDAQT